VIPNGLDPSHLAPGSPNAGVEYSDSTITSPPADLTEADLVGIFRFSDGFAHFEIHLQADHQFTAMMLHGLTQGGESLQRELTPQSAGTWEWANGNSVVFTDSTDKSHSEFTLASVAGHVALQEPAGRPILRRVYVKADRSAVDFSLDPTSRANSR